MQIFERGKCTEMRNERKCSVSLGSRIAMSGTISGMIYEKKRK